MVTGASTGIGEATVRALPAEGWTVFAVARRADRLAALAAETGAVAHSGGHYRGRRRRPGCLPQVTEAGGIDTLVNIAGGARGADNIGDASTEDWEWMYRVNVLGTMKLTRAFLPMLRANGEGTVLNLTSTAGLVAYEGGGGYNAAKFAQHAMTGALRLEEAEHNVRVIEVAPGLVQTEEFALNRLGDEAGRSQGLPGRGEAAHGRRRGRRGPLRRQRAAPREPGPDRHPARGPGRKPQTDPQGLSRPLCLQRPGRIRGRQHQIRHQAGMVGAGKDEALEVCHLHPGADQDMVHGDERWHLRIHRPGGGQALARGLGGVREPAWPARSRNSRWSALELKSPSRTVVPAGPCAGKVPNWRSSCRQFQMSPAR